MKTLTDSLAVSNAKRKLFRRKYSDLRSADGSARAGIGDKDRAKLEQRLLSAVSDLQIVAERARAYREQMLRLSEAILRC